MVLYHLKRIIYKQIETEQKYDSEIYVLNAEPV